MLNVKALSELLSKNSDDRLCKRWYMMTPNGTLLAYNQPTDVRDLRKQVALVAISWQEHDTARPASEKASSESDKPRPLHTLTMESDTANVIVRRLQPSLLLVLEGGVPPRKRALGSRITAEGQGGDLLLPPSQHNTASGVDSSASSVAESSRSSSAALSVLALQRKKLDALAAAIAEDFEQTGFKMPEGSTNQMF